MVELFDVALMELVGIVLETGYRRFEGSVNICLALVFAMEFVRI